MEVFPNKTNWRINKCTHRRLTIEHGINEHLRKQNYQSTIHSYKHQEQLFNRKINHLRKTLEHIKPYNEDIKEDEESLMVPNCLTRIQNHFRLLNFFSETEKRLLCQPVPYPKSKALPNVSSKRNSNQIDQCIQRVSVYQSRAAKSPSCRSATTNRFPPRTLVEQKTSRSYLNQQIFDERKKRMANDQRKGFLLKEFDELKHTIDDPHCTFSVLAALSRAIIFLDSGTE